MNLKNVHAAKNSLWDWTPLNECFGATKIRVTDIDGFVERKGRFLVIETKKPGDPIPEGQGLTFDALLKTGVFTIVLVWGRKDSPQEIRVLTRDERKNRHYIKDVSMDLLKKIVSEWFAFADSQQSSLTLPKSGSHVNSFKWDNSVLLVEALGHEGPCAGCGQEMRPKDYFRVADGKIMHLSCVRDWEARARSKEPSDTAYVTRRISPTTSNIFPASQS